MDVRSNWGSEEGHNLSKYVKITNQYPTELSDLLDENLCISLTRPEDDERSECQLKLRCFSSDPVLSLKSRCNSREAIKSVLILSEARSVEVYDGIHEEYVKTVHGEFIFDVGEPEENVGLGKVYKCRVDLAEPREVLSLKLKGLHVIDSVLVYALHAILQKTDSWPGASPFSCTNIAKVLQEKDVQMSDKAVKFLQTVELMSKSHTGKKYAGGMESMLASIMNAAVMRNLEGNPAPGHLVQGRYERVESSTTGNRGHGCSDGNKLREMLKLKEDATLDVKKFASDRFEGSMINGSGIERRCEGMKDWHEGMQVNGSKVSKDPQSFQMDSLLAKIKQLSVECYDRDDVDNMNSLVSLVTLAKDGTLLAEDAENGNGCKQSKPISKDYPSPQATGAHQSFTTGSGFSMMYLIENMVEKKLKQLEDRLLGIIDERLRESEERMMSKLENIEKLLKTNHSS